MIHLTFTGFYAGVRFCDKPRDDDEENAHAVSAPLAKPEYRAKCCADCLKLWDETEGENQ